jgi:protocatechuate 3,4-dioxygenase beta subunit
VKLVACTSATLLALLSSVPLAAQVEVCGTVHAGGRPLPAVSLRLFPYPDPFQQAGLSRRGEAFPPAAVEVRSSAGGAFCLAAPEPGMWLVVASAPGFLAMELDLAPLAEPVDLPDLDLRRPGEMAVQITGPAGEPIAGAWVSAAGTERSPPRRRQPLRWRVADRLAFTGADGAARLPAAAGEPLRLEVAADGWVPATAAATGGSHLAIGLQQGVRRTVTLKEATGEAGRKVVAWIPGIGLPVAEADERGQMSFTLPTGKAATVRFLAADGSFLETVLRPAERSHPSLLALERPLSASGRVIALANRDPVAGALVWRRGDPGFCVRTEGAGGYLLGLLPWDEGPIAAAAPGFFPEDAPLLAEPSEATPGPTFALARQGALVGRVVSLEGQPLADVDLRARFERTFESLFAMRFRDSGGDARTARAGRFRIGNLYPGSVYELRFAKDGYATRRLRVTVPEPAADAEPLEVVLEPGKVATGTVLDSAERPIAGALVHLRPGPTGDPLERVKGVTDPDPTLVLSASTDAAGRFEIRGVAPGRFDLRAEAGGCAPALVRGITLPGENGSYELGTVVLEKEALVVGRVEDPDGAPLAGASVTVVPSDPVAALAQTLHAEEADPGVVSDSAGWFVLHGQHPGGLVKLRAEKPGYGKAEAAGVKTPNEEPVVLVLPPTATLAGRVVDADGAPLPDVSIAVAELTSTVLFGGALPTAGGRTFKTTSAQDGTFTVAGVAPGRAELHAVAPGWHETVLPLRVPQDEEPIAVVLQRAAAARGRVLDPEGRPVVGAEVRLAEDELRAGVVMRYSSPLATSDGDGSYRIADLPLGPLSLVATHEAYGRSVRDLDAQPGDNQVDFQFSGGRRLSGSVLDALGNPVAGAAVRLHSSSPGWALPQTSSDADGRFQFTGLAPGAYALNAQRQGVGRTPEPVPVAVVDNDLDGVTLQLAPTGTIRGQILGLGVDDLAEVELQAGYLVGVGEVTYDGSYRIPDLSPGTWHVVARLPRTGRQAEGEATLEKDVPEADLDLDFSGGLTLSGEVLLNGQSLSAAAVQAVGSTGSSASTETDPGGLFRLEGLARDVYLLTVTGRSGLEHSEQVELAADRELRVELESAALSGVVVDTETLQPLREVTVEISGADGQPSRETSTQGDGTFRFSGVAAGPWRLTARKEGYAPDERRVDLAPEDEAQSVEISLAPTSGQTLVVTFFNGEPVPAAWVAVLDGSGGAAAAGSYEAGEGGRIRLRELPGGTWTLLVAAPGAGTARVVVVAPSGPVPVALPQPGTVLARAPDLTGQAGGLLRLLAPSGEPLRLVEPGGVVFDRWPVHGGEAEVSGW